MLKIHLNYQQCYKTSSSKENIKHYVFMFYHYQNETSYTIVSVVLFVHILICSKNRFVFGLCVVNGMAEKGLRAPRIVLQSAQRWQHIPYHHILKSTPYLCGRVCVCVFVPGCVLIVNARDRHFINHIICIAPLHISHYYPITRTRYAHTYSIYAREYYCYYPNLRQHATTLTTWGWCLRARLCV